MAAPCKNAIDNYVNGFDDSASKELSKDLISRGVVLTDVIEHLGVYLTNKETSTRARATRLIADILNNLPVDFLTHTQVSLLVTYLCEKLKDHHSLQGHALYGLLPLSQSPNLSRETVETICRTIFTEVHTQSLPQVDRRSVFTILHNFLSNRLEDVQQLEGDFVYGYIQTMDAEKDPRNLILAFNCANVVIQNFPLGVFVEEIFEVVSCYFPVDFTPSASDPSGIKREDLVLSLRHCLAATPRFAQYCLPLLLEKLTSDLKSAKIDSLETLAMCAERYSSESLHEYQTAFFNCIKKEVFLSGEAVLEEAALTALHALVKALSSGVTQSDRKKSLDGFVEEILTECKNHLLQPELMLMLSSGRLLQAAARGSDTACSQIVKTTVPLLIETYNIQKQATPRHNVMKVLNGFLECTIMFNYSKKNPNPILSTCKDPILAIYTQGLDDDEVSIQLLSVRGFHVLVTLPVHDLLDVERSIIASKLVNKSIQCTCEEGVRLACTDTLQYMLSTYTDGVQKDVLPTLFSLLQNESMSVDDSGYVSGPHLLEILSAITSGASTVHMVMKVLCDMLETTDSLEMYEAVSKCLASTARNCCTDSESITFLVNLGMKSIQKLVVTKCGCPEWHERLTNEAVLMNLSAFMRHIAINWQPELSVEIQPLFIQSFLAAKEQDDGQTDKSPLQVSCDTILVCLLMPIICSGPPQMVIQRQGEILQQLISLVFKSLDPAAHTHVCKCLSAVLNKHTPDANLDVILLDLKNKLDSCPEGSDKTKIRSQNVVTLSWIAKALVLRNHKLSIQYTEKLIQLLSDKEVGREAAQGFRIVLTEYEDVMNKAMRGNIRLMYRQRFFQDNLPKVVHGYNTACNETKKNYLMALSYLIRDVSKQVLIPELPQIYPLLIQSLLCNDLDLQLATMETLADLIHNAPKVVDKQIDSLIPQLLKLTIYKPSMKVRISALKCLSGLTVLPLHVILPYRTKVTRALLSVLDDRKRLVRSQAVIARQDWFLLEMDKK